MGVVWVFYGDHTFTFQLNGEEAFWASRGHSYRLSSSRVQLLQR